jgi:uncharacterized RDD family membrane protein YckC
VYRKAVFRIYCSNCGEEFAENVKFCTKCGASVTASEPKAEKTVFESFEKDPALQDYWIRRLVAYVIDLVILFVVTGILVGFAQFPTFLRNPLFFFDIFSFPVALGIVSVIYFVIAESVYGTSIGKSFLNLKVVTSSNERITIEKAFIRNISKIYGVLLFLDVVGGLVTSTELHKKYTDRMADAKVV